VLFVDHFLSFYGKEKKKLKQGKVIRLVLLITRKMSESGLHTAHIVNDLFLLPDTSNMTDSNGSMPNSNATENGDKSANNQILETEKERSERFRSLWIVYFTMFLISLGFSIVLTGLWPYLDTVRNHYFLSLCLSC
jgi:hypothetical protein